MCNTKNFVNSVVPSVLQWNCNGFSKKKDEIIHLISQHQPTIVALQETRLRTESSCNIPGYDVARREGHTNYNAHGGVAIFIHNQTPFRKIPLKTDIQAVAIQAHLHRLVTICNIYSSRSHVLTLKSLQELVKQLPPPYAIVGDFNGYHTMWGSPVIDKRGIIIEKLIAESNLVVLNTGSVTRIGHNSESAIDLSLASPELAAGVNWSTLKSPGDSDHIPIIISMLSSQPSSPSPIQGWNIRKANWKTYKAHPAWNNLPTDIDDWNNEELYNCLIEKITQAADSSIPRYSYKGPYFPSPWWTPDVQDSYNERESLYKKWRRRRTYQNLIKWKQARAKHKQLMIKAKKEAWIKLSNEITSSTPLNRVWENIRRIKGKEKRIIPILTDGDNIYSTPQEIANKLAENFQKVSSTENYKPSFQKHRTRAERSQLNFDDNMQAKYNEIFSKQEFDKTLRTLMDKAPGPDGIFNSMLTQLPDKAQEFLLKLINRFWRDSYYPKQWKLAFIIAIPKPGKEHNNPQNYRPIALTSNICKLVERLINNRLTDFMDMQGIFTNIQSGCRKSRSTMDHLITLESSIRTAFSHNEHFISVFFDLEKAYDTTWRYGIMRDLHSYGMRGRLPLYIGRFLEDRSFQVRMNSTLSDVHVQQSGVPQGGVLSVTLFAIKINGVAEIISRYPGVYASLYVDDLHIGYNHADPIVATTHLQECLNHVSQWADLNGFKFSQSKTRAMHFNNNRGITIAPDMNLYGEIIPYTTTYKFLGLVWDCGLSWDCHINYLRGRCMKVINLLRSVSSHHWGSDQKTLMLLYKSLLRSKIDYGFIVFGSASKKSLAPLMTVANNALRIATGAFLSTPIDSLYVLANEIPLDLRYQMLSMRYFYLIRSQINNPANFIALQQGNDRLFKNKQLTPPFALRVNRMIKQYQLTTGPIQPMFSYRLLSIKTPSWSIDPPCVNLNLANYHKSDTKPALYTKLFQDMIESKYKHFSILYTDGSKTATGVGAACVFNSVVTKASLPKESNIMTAEMHGIRIALTTIKSKPVGKYVIMTDSKSTLSLIENMTFENDTTRRIVHCIDELCVSGRYVELCWIPSHVGILGNNMADAAAKSAAHTEAEFVPIHHSNWKPIIYNVIKNEWNKRWQSSKHQLQNIHPTVSYLTPYSKNRREEVILNRLRFGHSNITHGYLMDSESLPIPPICPFCCSAAITVPHILLKCSSLDHIRKKSLPISIIGPNPTLKSLLEECGPISEVLQYIKDIGIAPSI